MAYAKYKRRFRRRRRKRRKKARGVTVREARSARVNSAAEMAVKIIAKREAEKAVQASEIRLISRMHLFSAYDDNTNAHGPPASVVGQRITWDGVVVPITQIPKMDIEFTQAVFAQDIPESMEDEANIGQGVGHGAPVKTGHGTRSKDFIKCRGFSMNLRSWCETLVQGELARQYDNIIIHYALVRVRVDELATQVGFEPTCDRVLPIRTWGYSAKLDVKEANLSANFKYSTLFKGSLSLHPTTTGCVQKNTNRYFKFKKPLLCQYMPDDQTGEKPLKYSLFFCLRSNIPTSHVNEQAWCSAVTKLFYTDV